MPALHTEPTGSQPDFFRFLKLRIGRTSTIASGALVPFACNRRDYTTTYFSYAIAPGLSDEKVALRIHGYRRRKRKC